MVGIIPKPSSINAAALAWARHRFRVIDITRSGLGGPDGRRLLRSLTSAGRPLVLLDMGGYFAPSLREVRDGRAEGILGVVEDTENGYQRYLSDSQRREPPVPIYSLARSPLKDPEDYLVGHSVVFSVERLIRSCGHVLQGREAVVFGYGKVGRSIAAVMQSKNIHTLVVEPDPIRAIEALSRGFRTVDKQAALQVGTLLLGASGHLSLLASDLEHVRDGAFIASVTSHDDELELDDSVRRSSFSGPATTYTREDIMPHVTRYARPGQHFYVMNRGDAVNFLDSAVVGPFIYLVQAELLAALHILATAPPDPGFYEVPQEARSRIATTWLETYASD